MIDDRLIAQVGISLRKIHIRKSITEIGEWLVIMSDPPIVLWKLVNYRFSLACELPSLLGPPSLSMFGLECLYGNLLPIARTTELYPV